MVFWSNSHPNTIHFRFWPNFQANTIHFSALKSKLHVDSWYLILERITKWKHSSNAIQVEKTIYFSRKEHEQNVSSANSCNRSPSSNITFGKTNLEHPSQRQCETNCAINFVLYINQTAIDNLNNCIMQHVMLFNILALAKPKEHSNSLIDNAIKWWLKPRFVWEKILPGWKIGRFHSCAKKPNHRNHKPNKFKAVLGRQKTIKLYFQASFQGT